ncbi:tripartite tricarboxylate transporter permease [Alloalcanivorax sp. C16-2]|uniref:tripartite tricarboxylate transporter permease n=1 Tax=Alloalcanivorax sp. C16-2 TaxID=3390052 RepID=UPI0039706781
MEWFAHLAAVFEPLNLLILFLGVTGGLVLGAIPGVSPTLSVALLVPFTFHMAPTTGLILIGAVYASSIAGGAVSAILINVPGAPANIATTFDGHEMARQGRASEAMQYAFTSTLVGGVAGMLILIFLAPLFVDYVLRFGPAEMFWVAIVGITIMASLGTGSLLKGLFGGALGIWISTIGISPATGQSRFVFTHHLDGGIHIVVALIAFFAIPQVFRLLESRAAVASQAVVSQASRLTTVVRNALGHRLAMGLGTLVGAIVGIIPGAGGQVASIIGYDQVRKLSRDNATFGHGDPRGVVASESANSAMVGPSLIPLLGLGVPGSPTCAVLLGGLLIHGIFPGPKLFETSGGVIWPFLGALLLAQVLIFFVGLQLSRLGHLVTRVSPAHLAAGILVLSVIGTYSIQNNLGDVYVMAGLGVLMYLGIKGGFQPAPVVLGVILGPIAEENFQMGRTLAGPSGSVLDYFTSGDIVQVLMALAVISLAYGMLAPIWRARRRPATSVGAGL